MAAPKFPDEVVAFRDKLAKEAKDGGYNLNPDENFTLQLAQGLLDNLHRLGHAACPCRLAFGDKTKDIDIICPCYYRDPDIDQFGTCYCALYVSEDWIAGKVKKGSIPDRRPERFVADGYSESDPSTPGSVSSQVPSGGSTLDSSKPALSYPVWRCKVCGYLAARDEPPGKCPVCKAGKERFERFM